MSAIDVAAVRLRAKRGALQSPLAWPTAAQLAVLAALLLACGGGSDSADRFVMDNLSAQLRQQNAQHYAFGCVDEDGTVLSGSYSVEAIAESAGIEHAAASWTSDTRGVVLGADQQYIVIYDPQSRATNASQFKTREVAIEQGHLTCLVP